MLKKIYFILAIAGIVYLLLLSYLTLQTILSGLNIKDLTTSYYSYQTLISISNVVLFIVLLIFSCSIFYKNPMITFFIITTVIFIFFTLVNHWYLAKFFYEKTYSSGPLTNEYTLNLMLASFYCIGSIAISAISGITIKNFKNRVKK